MANVLQRLKQRKLVQWTIAYVAFAFAVIQVLDAVADSYSWPHVVMHIAFGVLALGFVVMLVLAWYHGERGIQRLGGGELLIIALLLAIGGGLIWRFGESGAHVARTARVTAAHERTPVAAASVAASSPPFATPGTGATQSIPTKSVAVLPFANESGKKDQQYFSDGLSEDLITTLSQLAGLKVISRDSAFQFRDSKDSAAKIGRLLGVAHLLEGSVQRAGNEVRITATLVNAADGTVVWSHRYDKPYKDIFALQDAITKAVAGALKAKLMTAPGVVVQSDKPPNGSLRAYNDLLQGGFYARRGLNAGNLRKALGYFTDATRLDSDYALAWAAMGNIRADLAGNFLHGSQATQAWDKARADVHKALSLDPNLAAAHSDNAFILSSVDHDWARAEAEAQRAYELAPDKYFSTLATARATLGHIRQAVELIRHGLPTDPLCAGCYGYLARILPALGRFDQAVDAARKALQLLPTDYFMRVQLVYIEAMRGDATVALRAAQREPPGMWRDMATAMALQIGGNRAAAKAALRQEIATQAGTGAYQIAEIYALRRDPDDMFKWLERASANHDPGVTLLLSDAPILRYRHDPRFAAFCKKVGLPTTTDAVAMK